METVAQDKLQVMYDHYKQTTDDQIREHLTHIKLVKKVGRHYLQLSQEFMEQLKQNPRGISPYYGASFTNGDFDPEPVRGLKVWKKFTYLVKSSSRFFLKPDVGEIFDQLDPADLEHIKAIDLNGDYETLPVPERDEFLVDCTLLVDRDFQP